MKTKPLTHFDAFSGYAGFTIAAQRHGIETVGFSEIDKNACAVLKYRFPDVPNFGDITAINPDELPDFDLLTGGFPCVKDDTLIITRRGTIPITEVIEGDYVLTHKNRFRKVLKTMNRKVKGIYKVSIENSPEIFITGEHPFYGSKMIRKWNNEKRTAERHFSMAGWIDTKDLRDDDFIAFANYSNKHTENKYNLTDEECWLIGRFVADGWMTNKNIFLAIGKSKMLEFKKRVTTIKYSISEERTAYRIYINKNDRLHDLCKRCGHGAVNKKIPFEIMNLPSWKLKHFLDGYMSGDGCFTNERFAATSTSKILIYQLAQIVYRLFQTPINISYCRRPKKTIIEGRIVNQHDTWQIRFDKINHKTENSVYLNGNIYGRFKWKEHLPAWEGIVYNLEVEEDNSYTANNSIVHNCQSYSIAGKRGGLEDLRGQVIYDVFRILRAKKPKWFILENVKGLLNHDSGKSAGLICTLLRESGYAVDEKVLNTKEFGISQNRERVFIVGLREEDCGTVPDFWHFDFPVPPKTPCKLIDILEDKVDEKYYLSEKIQNRLKLDLQALKSGKNIVGTTKGDECTRIGQRDNVNNPDGVIGALKATDYKQPPQLLELTKNSSQGYRVYNTDGISTTLASGAGGVGAKTGLYAIPKATKQGYAVAEEGDSINLSVPNSKTRRGRVGKGVAQTLDTGVQQYTLKKARIRRLTPTECMRLQGLEDDWCNYGINEKGEYKLSDTAKYKLAGNGVTVDVVEAIVKQIINF